MFGLSEEDFQFIIKTLKNLNRMDTMVWVFGSRARGDNSQFSDLDLMVETSDDVSEELREIREIFDESNLPIKVDIVSAKDFADSYKDSYMKDRKKLCS